MSHNTTSKKIHIFTFVASVVVGVMNESVLLGMLLFVFWEIMIEKG